MVEQALTPEHAASECRALVARDPASPRRRAAARPVAFLAHLIAMKQQHPQTRDRRRVEPAEAVNAYRAVMKASVAYTNLRQIIPPLIPAKAGIQI